MPLDPTIQTTFAELYIPARTLPYGLYQLTLKLSMVTASQLSSSTSAYVRITPSSIIANLVQLGSSMITRGNEQDLVLDPGRYSADPDGATFNATVSHPIFE